LRANRRENVEIDVCPQCKGIWLDAGELERLTQAEDDYYDNRRRDRNDRDDDDDDEGGSGGFFRNLLGGLGD
jgi:Zn-finger nucleic acid-binding protein